MPIRKIAFEAANRRAAERLRTDAMATTARYDRRSGRVVVNLASGLQVAFRARDAEGLGQATAEQLADIEITPSGLGLHFPRLDADLHRPALLERYLGSRRRTAAEIGRAGGRVSSAAKSAAARKNGRLGSRPRKAKAVPA